MHSTSMRGSSHLTRMYDSMWFNMGCGAFICFMILLVACFVGGMWVGGMTGGLPW